MGCAYMPVAKKAKDKSDINSTASYTDEELNFLRFVDEWRTTKNRNIWPKTVQYLALVKEFISNGEAIEKSANFTQD